MKPSQHLWALVLLALGCAPKVGYEDDPDPLVIAGSETIVRTLLPPLAETHHRTVGTLEFELRGGGTAQGMRDMLSGQAHLAAASRQAIFAEEEQARTNGYSLRSDDSRHIIAVDVVAISGNPAMPLDSLTYDQVIGIWCSRTITDWSHLGLDSAPIRALTVDPSSGNRVLFEDFFCGPRGIHSHVEVVSQEDMAKIVAEDPSALGYFSLAETAGKVLGLRAEPDGHTVEPTQQNILRGSYPLYHDLYLYSPGSPRGASHEFLDWIASPAGQEVVDEAGFVPLFLRPDRMDEPRPLRETIHFEPGSTEPNQRSAARLDLLVAELKARTGAIRHVILEGYTDNQEDDQVALSKARAESVKVLLEDDLPGLFYEIIPRGDLNPIAPNETPYGRQRNRRVQIYLAEEEADGPILVEPPAQD